MAVKSSVRPSALSPVRSPVVAKVSLRSVTIRTWTDGLDGVTNGSPWFGRVNVVRRLTHGSQRYRSMIPFAFVNIQFEPDRFVCSVAPNRTRMAVVPPIGRIPPSGTTIVWSLRSP